MKPSQIAHALALAIAALALFAPSAFAASEFEAENYPDKIAGTQGGKSKVFTAEEVAVTCAATSTGELTKSTETLTITPVYSECTSFGGVSVTVKMNGCQYVLHGGEEVGEEESGNFTGTMDVKCPTGQVIAITALTCEVQIGAQTGLSAIEFKDELEASPKAKLLATFNVGKAKYTKTKDGFLCPLMGTGEKENGAVSGTQLFSGSREEEAQGVAMQKGSKTKLCKEAPKPKTPCKMIYPKGTSIKATSDIEDSIGLDITNVGCATKGSKFSAVTVEDEEAPLHLEKVTMTFGSCQTLAKTKCTVEMVNKSTTGTLASLAILSPGNGDLYVPMIIYIECGTEVKCQYFSNALYMQFTGGKNTAYLFFSKQALEKETFPTEINCSKNANWTGLYAIEDPAAIWTVR